MPNHELDRWEEVYDSAERIIEEAYAAGSTSLELAALRLVELPESIGQLTQLQTLDLSDNELSQLPESIGQLTQLQTLDLSDNELSQLPNSIGQLTQLQILDLSHNNLSELPESIGQLTQLQTLDLSDNELSQLPNSIGQLTQLTGLYLSRNDLIELPNSIGQLTQLQTLDASRNELTELPNSIGQLTQLQKLYLYNNQLSVLPESIGQLTQLQTLYVFSNELTELPESIGQLTQLQTLDIFINELTELPESIGQLTQLQTLDIFSNELTELPESIGQLTQLQTLDLARNELTELPESIGQLTQLQTLDLANNDLHELPEKLLSLAEVGTLKKLFLHDNDHLGIPREILGPSSETIRDWQRSQFSEGKQIKAQDPVRLTRYYRQVLSGPARPLNEAKVLVVGPGGNGKSTLIEFLRTGKFHPGKKATEGIQVLPWEPTSNTEEKLLRLNIWDFGGQELQYSTHEFFLSERAVYVLVFQHRDDIATPDGLFHWLDLIHLVAPEAPVIVAFSKQDEYPGLPNGLGDLQKVHPKIVGWHQISCNTRDTKAEHFVENACALRKVVMETAYRELSHIHYKLPAAWMAVKEQLEVPNHDYLSFSDFQQLCADKGVTDLEDQKLLADYLHDLGTMLNYADRMAYEQTHILNPEWVTSGVYALSIWAEELGHTDGILTDSRVCQRLSEPQFNDKYPPLAQRFILEMMLSFKLCYELPRPGKERLYLVPNALPEAPPQPSFDELDALRFEIRFPRIMPTSIISRFIVEMHKRGTFQQWRLGVQGTMLEHPFRVSAHPKQKTIRIAVAGQGPARIRVLEIIRAEFAAICRERDYGEKEYTFPPGHQNAEPYPFSNLLEAERNGKSSIWLADGVGDISVQDWLNGITYPDERKKLQASLKELTERNGRIIVAGEYYEGDKVSEHRKISIGGDANGPINQGNDAAVGQNIIKGDNNDQRILQLSKNPAELKAEIEKLRDLIQQARTAGADEDDCDFAEKKVTQLEAAAENPNDEANKEKASGALKRLKDIAEGFKNYAEIGTSFETILKLVGPALGALLGTQMPI